MFRHHHDEDAQPEPDAPLTETAEGMVLSSVAVPGEKGMMTVRLNVRFQDRSQVEHSEVIDSLWQPDPDSPEGKKVIATRTAAGVKNPEHMPKIQLPLSSGERVKIRHDPKRKHLTVDMDALKAHGLTFWIERNGPPKPQAPAKKGALTGPPWKVPAQCPNCEAPVDQATASKAADPHCPYCRQPIPVEPVR